mgnify:CR=1 FL=1
MEEAEEQNQMAMGASSLEVVASCSEEADLDPFASASASAFAFEKVFHQSVIVVVGVDLSPNSSEAPYLFVEVGVEPRNLEEAEEAYLEAYSASKLEEVV